MSSITSRLDVLKAGGIDPSKYPAFGGIVGGSFVDSEAAAEIRGTDEPAESCAVKSNEVFFGENSKFYKKVMADGNIYNPYIHRRWLPAQFRRIILKAGCDNVNSYVKTNYDWRYVIRFLKEEVDKLALLEKRDPQAFDERSKFFSLRAINLILDDYKDMVFKVLDDGEDMIRRISCDRKYSTDIVGFGVVKLEHIRPIKHRFDLFCQSVQDCNDYAQLSCLFKAFRFAKLPSSYNISDSFVRPFVDAGAYYTLKHMIMFEGLSLGGENVADDIRRLEMHEGQQKGYMGLFTELVNKCQPEPEKIDG